MKIHRVRINGLMAHRATDLEWAPLTVIGGPNGSGKSSLCQAIKWCLVGGGIRGLSKATQLPALVSTGSSSGFVEVTWSRPDGTVEVVSRRVPGGKAVGSLPTPGALPLSLEADYFSSLRPEERQSLLFEIAAIRVTPEEVLRRLTAGGCQVDLAGLKRVAGRVVAGFPAAFAAAHEQVSQARGAWRAVTGQAYGSRIAVHWAATTRNPPDLGGAMPSHLEDELDRLHKKLAPMQNRLGILTEKLSRAEELDARIEDLARHITVPQDVERGLEKMEEDYADARTQAEKLREYAESLSKSKNRYLCPREGCGQQMAFDPSANTLVAVDPNDDTGTANPAEIAKARLAADQAARVMESALTRLHSARQAINVQTQNQATHDALVRERRDLDPDAIRQEILSLNADLASDGGRAPEIAATLQEYKAFVQERDTANQKTQQAAAFHGEVLAWQAIERALGAEGIPLDLVSAAIGPLNQRLAAHAANTGWMPVRLGEDMGIEVNGLPYSLRSSSEQWRTDAMLAVAIAEISEDNLVVLDGLDILEPTARPGCFRWLYQLTQGALQVMVTATLKEPMSERDGMRFHWMKQGD
ncbi:putative Chromosome segregation protein [Gammaproteobacteria bacterium]